MQKAPPSTEYQTRPSFVKKDFCINSKETSRAIFWKQEHFQQQLYENNSKVIKHEVDSIKYRINSAFII